MNARVFAALFLLALSISLYSQSDEPSPECKKYLATPLPAEATQIPAPKTWPNCNSYKLYSGIGTKVDYAAARKCAWAERLSRSSELETDNYLAGQVGGTSMLVTLYANGEGVAQNKPLALRLACEDDLDKDGLKKIESLPASPLSEKEKYDRCEFAYTTIEMNFCVVWDSEISQQRRNDALDAISSHWPADQKAAFTQLLTAKETYVEAHGDGETYLGGTIHTLRVFGVEADLRNKFLDAVKEFESGRLPKGTQSDFKRADTELNSTYRKALELAAAQDDGDDGNIQPKGIRQAERAWLHYRDAWVAFAKLRYPGTDSSAWLIAADHQSRLQPAKHAVQSRLGSPCMQEQGERR